MESGNLQFFLCVIGMVLVLEGLPYFAFPDKLKTLYARIHEIPEGSMRMFGFIAIVIGLLLVYLGTST